VRLQLIAAVLLAAPANAAAQAEDERRADASVRVYADDDHVTVWSPAASATVPLSERAVVEAGVTIDAVTAASVDVTSTASPYAFTERRTEGTLAGRLAVRDQRWLAARATYSDENDYTSLHLGASGLAELADRNTTVELSYTAAFDTVGRAGDPSFAEARRGHRLAATLTQVTDERGYLDLVIDADHGAGYLANPYRYVPISMDGAPTYSLPERVPDRRTAIAGLIRVRRQTAESWYGAADARICRDTWGLTSGTATARLLHAVRDDGLLIGAELRGYVQSAASFHRAAYAGDDGAPAWRTRDRSLGPMYSVTIGGIADAVLPWRETRVTGSLAWARFGWPGDLLQRRRDAAIVSLAIQISF
jgi:hypothetical protein